MRPCAATVDLIASGESAWNDSDSPGMFALQSTANGDEAASGAAAGSDGCIGSWTEVVG